MNAKNVVFSLVSWNVRGLSDCDKCRLVRDALSSARTDIACLQESKLSTTSAAKARSFLPPHLSDFHCVDATTTRGGIVTAWNARTFTLTSFLSRQRSLTTFFTSTASNYSFAVTNVFAPSDHRDSIAFLEDLEEVASNVHGNWVLCGDFNLTRGSDDNSNGNVHQNLADAFNGCINRLGVIDIPLLDRLFTWSNQRSNPTLAQLDRVFFNVEMSLSFPNSSLTSLPKPTSDHTPLQLRFSTEIPKPNLFRFENAWLKHQDYLPTVLPAWQSAGNGNATAIVVGSLKAVRCASKVWSRRKRAPPSLHYNCKFVIYLLDVLEEGRVLSAGEQCLRQCCQDRLALFLRERAAYWKQWGKHRAIREGDANTRFFHAHACARLRRNNIRALEVDGVLVTTHNAKARALTNHLSALLGVHSPSTPLDVAALYAGVAPVNSTPLLAPFTEQEAHAAVRAMNRNSSPGPDGFGPSFYDAAWTTVAPSVLNMAAEFHAGTAELERVNRAYVVMIPKIATALTPNDYRPICLQNCALKIIDKMLTCGFSGRFQG
ncbi:unnamed protein product [Urochloa humidicola]